MIFLIPSTASRVPLFLTGVSCISLNPLLSMIHSFPSPPLPPSQLFDLGEEGDQNETDGVMVASQSEVGYSCERQHTYRSGTLLPSLPLHLLFLMSLPAIYRVLFKVFKVN